MKTKLFAIAMILSTLLTAGCSSTNEPAIKGVEVSSPYPLHVQGLDSTPYNEPYNGTVYTYSSLKSTNITKNWTVSNNASGTITMGTWNGTTNSSNITFSGNPHSLTSLMSTMREWSWNDEIFVYYYSWFYISSPISTEEK